MTNYDEKAIARGTARLLKQQEKPLTEMQQQFVIEYLIDLNATQAWIRAGGDPQSATIVASRLMRKGGNVWAAVQRALAERSSRVGVTADRVVMEFARIAFGDPRVLFNEDGSLKAPGQYNADDARMIAGVKTRRIVELGKDEDGNQIMQQAEIQEVRLESKTGALTALGRHLGLFNDKLDVSITPLDQRFAEAMARVNGDSGRVIDGDAEDIEDDEESDVLSGIDDPALRNMLR